MHSSPMALLAELRVVQLGDGLAAAVCGRLLADIGAGVIAVDPEASTHLGQHLNHGKTIVSGDSGQACDALAIADLIICEGRPDDLLARRI